MDRTVNEQDTNTYIYIYIRTPLIQPNNKTDLTVNKKETHFYKRREESEK